MRKTKTSKTARRSVNVAARALRTEGAFRPKTFRNRKRYDRKRVKRQDRKA